MATHNIDLPTSKMEKVQNQEICKQKKKVKEHMKLEQQLIREKKWLEKK
ncbi:2849_t:CDS:2 [Gigaspora margarita]|uniref:2849_t:CDS:1 n=1 Tax=Gigaspora margarita TaxID=4874 RepID=A0ABM8VVV8_GIGMA|nr:2849_t:CDS:2 [Gigaspora margarita]